MRQKRLDNKRRVCYHNDATEVLSLIGSSLSFILLKRGAAGKLAAFLFCFKKTSIKLRENDRSASLMNRAVFCYNYLEKRKVLTHGLYRVFCRARY